VKHPLDARHAAYTAFQEAWRGYPSQDNEGFVPDRSGFKCGWFAALQWRESVEPEPMRVKKPFDAPRWHLWAWVWLRVLDGAAIGLYVLVVFGLAKIVRWILK
jgi:hypothetical protein